MPEFRPGADAVARPEIAEAAAARCALAFSRAALVAMANLSPEARAAVDDALAFEIHVLDSETGRAAADAATAARETREWLNDLSETGSRDTAALENAILALADGLNGPTTCRAA